MKKNKLINKKLMFLLVFSLSFFIFVGCQSKASTNDSKTNTGNNKIFNSDAMKKQMQTSINPLVSNKTLTQVQEDKIVAALIPSNTKKNNTNGNSQSKKSGQGSGTKGVKANREEVALTKLVTDKVITQVQADAVKKVVKVTTRSQNSKPSST